MKRPRPKIIIPGVKLGEGAWIQSIDSGMLSIHSIRSVIDVDITHEFVENGRMRMALDNGTPTASFWVKFRESGITSLTGLPDGVNVIMEREHHIRDLDGSPVLGTIALKDSDLPSLKGLRTSPQSSVYLQTYGSDYWPILLANTWKTLCLPDMPHTPLLSLVTAIHTGEIYAYRGENQSHIATPAFKIINDAKAAVKAGTWGPRRAAMWAQSELFKIGRQDNARFIS